MTIRSSLLFAAVAFAGVVSMSKGAWALGPVDIEVAARGGVASSPTSDSPNPLGAGIGARAGVAALGFYGGVSFMYYFGGSDSEDGVSVSNHTFMYGVEGGYSIGVPFFTLRPMVGVGNMEVSGKADTDLGETTGSTNNLYIEPGIAAFLTFGQFMIGADGDLLFVPNIDSAKVSGVGNLQVGMKF